jgi:hypothetical protein
LSNSFSAGAFHFNEDFAMKNFIFSAYLIFILTAGVFAAPEPAVIQGENEWTVDVKFDHPRRISVSSGGGEHLYWYVILTVTNHTGKDVDFYPSCELMTSTCNIIPAGKNVGSAVFKTIKKRHKSEYPFLEWIQNTSSKILQGEDNTKDLAVIFPDFTSKADGFKIFISGLSNETAVIEHPTAKDENGEAVKIFLRKTLELDYKLKGDTSLRKEVKLEPQGKGWIMR